MPFVNPFLLAGVSLVAIPIVLHLVMRRKPQYFEFPALRFVRRQLDKNRRRLRLRHLLLLLLRAVALALLAFALARPVVNSSTIGSGEESPVAAALLFDTSVRMDYRHDNQTRLEAAQDLGLWLLKQFPRDSEVAVLDSRRVPAAFQVDRSAARKRIETLSTVAESRAMTAMLETAADLLETSDLTVREVYVFTDLSRQTWLGDEPSALRRGLDALSSVGVYVIDVGVEEPRNIRLAECRLSKEVLSQGSDLDIELQLDGLNVDTAGQTVELFVVDESGEPQKRDQQTIDRWPASGGLVLPFRIGPLSAGTRQGYLQLLGGDALDVDDRRTFTVDVKPPWRILLAAPKPIKSTSLYVASMLSPPAFRKTGRSPFECDVVSYENLSGRPLDPYAAVFLLDPPPIEPATWQAMVDFVADGRGVGVLLGDNARRETTFDDDVAQEILPGRLLGQGRAPEGDVALAPQNYRHPVLASLRSRAGAIPWRSAPVLRYWQLEGMPPGSQVVVPLSNGEPAIIDRPLGRGRVVVFTTPLSDPPSPDAWNLLTWSDFWPTVLLMRDVATYLVGAGEERLNYRAGQSVRLSVDQADAARSYVVVEPDGSTFPVQADLDDQAIVVTNPQRLGNYQVLAGGATRGIDRGFSVNLPPEATDLRRASRDAVEEVFGDTPVRWASSREEIEREVTSLRVGTELFPFLAMLLAVVLAAEHVVGNRFYS